MIKLFALISALLIFQYAIPRVPIFRPLYPIYALESSESGDLIKQKIEDLKTQIASKAAKIKAEISKKLQNKLILGQVLEVSDKTITITTGEEEKKVLTNEYTSFARKDSNKKVDSASIKTNTYLTVLGDIDDKGQVLAKKVILSESLELKNRIITEAQVVSVDAKSLQLNIAGTIETFTINKKTVISSLAKNVTLKDISSGASVYIVAVRDEKETLVRFIHLPDKPVKPSPKVATTSAKASSSSANQKKN